MAERDQWGRIPAVLIEQDQEFCALRWSELPCQAGPQSNFQIYSAAFGESPLWVTTGTVSGTFPASIGDTTFGGNNKVAIATGGEFVSITVANRALLPTLTETTRVYASFVYGLITSIDTLALGIAITDSDGEVSVVGFDYDATTETASAIDAGVNDITVTDTADINFKRVSFWIDTADFVLDGRAYTMFLDFRAISGTGDIEIGLPKLSLGADTEYRQTEDEPKLANVEPCFNTVSSCQALQTYSVAGRADALALIITA